MPPIPRSRRPRPRQAGRVAPNTFFVGSGGAGSLGSAYSQALDKANRENERRYGQLLQGYDDLHGRVMGQVNQLGDQARRDISERYRNMGSDVYNRLVGRGFANSTLPATMQMGVMREQSDAENRLRESLTRERAGYDTALTQGKLGVIERRTDAGPDLNQLLQLAQGMGRYGGGGYGGYGGGGGVSFVSPGALGYQMPQFFFGGARGYGGGGLGRVYGNRPQRASRNAAAANFVGPPRHLMDKEATRFADFGQAPVPVSPQQTLNTLGNLAQGAAQAIGNVPNQIGNAYSAIGSALFPQQQEGFAGWPAKPPPFVGPVNFAGPPRSLMSPPLNAPLGSIYNPAPRGPESSWQYNPTDMTEYATRHLTGRKPYAPKSSVPPIARIWAQMNAPFGIESLLLGNR